MSDEVVAPDTPETPMEEEETGKEMDTVGKDSGFLNFSDMQSKDFVPLAAMTDSNSNLPVSDMPSLDSRKEEEEAKEMVTVDNDSTFIKFEDMNSRDFRALDSVGDEPAPSALADVEPVKQIQFAELGSGSDDDVGAVEMAEIGHNSGVLVDFADMKSTDFPAAVVSLKTPPSLLSGSTGVPGSVDETPGMPPKIGKLDVDGLPNVQTPPRSLGTEDIDVKDDEAQREPTKMDGLDLLDLDMDAK